MAQENLQIRQILQENSRTNPQSHATHAQNVNSANKVAFIMPIYPPHYGYAREFIESFFEFEMDAQADLIFVFTDENDAASFKKPYFTGFYKAAILPPLLRVSRENAIVDIKKFYALRCFAGSYDYLIAIDSESQIIKKLDLHALCEEFYERKILYGNETTDNEALTRAIKDPSRQPFEPCCVPNDHLYFWFNQPCIYKGEFVGEFFAAAKLTRDEDFLRLRWGCFDYYIYGYFLILRKGFVIEDVEVATTSCSFMEINKHSPFTLRSEKYKQIEFLQCHPDLLGSLRDDKLFLIIHKDRKPQAPQNRVVELNFRSKTLKRWLKLGGKILPSRNARRQCRRLLGLFGCDKISVPS